MNPSPSGAALEVLVVAGDEDGDWNFVSMALGSSSCVNRLVWICLTSKAWSVLQGCSPLLEGEMYSALGKVACVTTIH